MNPVPKFASSHFPFEKMRQQRDHTYGALKFIHLKTGLISESSLPSITFASQEQLWLE